MNANKRRIVLVVGGCSIALVALLLTLILTFKLDSYKARIEAIASGAMGLDVKIHGKIWISFFPFGVSAKDIHIANKGDEILSIEDLKAVVEVMPLLKKQFSVTRCELFTPTIRIVKGATGQYNFEGTEKKSTDGSRVPFRLGGLKLFKGVFAYVDQTTGNTIEFRDFDLVIWGLSIGDTVADILKNASFTGSFDCKQVLQEHFRLEGLKASIRAVKGKYNFDPIVIRSIVYFGTRANDATELSEINLTINDLFARYGSYFLLNDIAFTGNLVCNEVRTRDLHIENIKSPIKVEKGVIYLTPLTMDIFGSKGEGEVTADESQADAVYGVNLKVSKLEFEKLGESFGTRKTIAGKGDLSAALTIKGKGNRSLMSSMQGSFSLRGDNLIIYTMDLDKVLSSYEASQKFNLVDLGAFFIAGPLGTLALKGYRYGDVYNQTQGGQGTITQFISHWKIKDGVADATDCAFATHHNRVALKGRLDLVNERYDNVIVALLDDKGCAKFKQTVAGSFGSPELGAVSAVESLAGPILNLYREAKRFVQGGKCDVFYSGAVQQAVE